MSSIDQAYIVIKPYDLHLAINVIYGSQSLKVKLQTTSECIHQNAQSFVIVACPASNQCPLGSTSRLGLDYTGKAKSCYDGGQRGRARHLDQCGAYHVETSKE